MNTDIIEGKWKQVMAAAKSEWADLTEDDLKKAEAGEEYLVGRVQERYGKTRQEAHDEVKKFLKKHHH